MVDHRWNEALRGLVLGFTFSYSTFRIANFPPILEFLLGSLRIFTRFDLRADDECMSACTAGVCVLERLSRRTERNRQRFLRSWFLMDDVDEVGRILVLGFCIFLTWVWKRIFRDTNLWAFLVCENLPFVLSTTTSIWILGPWLLFLLKALLSFDFLSNSLSYHIIASVVSFS